MFGKPYSEYIRFQAPILIAMALVGLLRLVLSIAGLPDSTVKFVSVSAVGFAGIVYYGVRVRRLASVASTERRLMDSATGSLGR